MDSIKQVTSHWSAKQISILLTIIALILWSYSITQAKLNIGFYGLIHSFPVTFFVALGILTIASAILWVSKGSHQKLLLLQLLLLITALWLGPLLIGSSPEPHEIYRNFELTNSIAQRGRLLDYGYLSWPGAFILFSIVNKLGSINFEPVLNIFPFFMQLLYLLPLYVFLRNVLGKARVNYCWAGLWFFLSATGLLQFISPRKVSLTYYC